MNIAITAIMLTFMHVPLDVSLPLRVVAVEEQQRQPNVYAQFDRPKD